jgi:hypothetical protein
MSEYQEVFGLRFKMFRSTVIDLCCFGIENTSEFRRFWLPLINITICCNCDMLNKVKELHNSGSYLSQD